MEIKCAYSDLVPLKKLRPNPKNPNRHPREQIVRLAKQIGVQGIRKPIIVSKRSGLMVTGHGTLEALEILKVARAPVSVQKFKNEAEEYAHMVADNGLSSWAAMDFGQINADIGELGPDFDLELLGLKNFSVDVADKEEKRESDIQSQSDDVTKVILFFTRERHEAVMSKVMRLNSQLHTNNLSDLFEILVENAHTQLKRDVRVRRASN